MRIEEFLASDFSSEFRARFGLAPDDRFLVLRRGDSLIMKRLEKPTKSTFSSLLDRVHKAVEEAPESIGPETVQREIEACRREANQG